MLTPFLWASSEQEGTEAVLWVGRNTISAMTEGGLRGAVEAGARLGPNLIP